MPTDTKRVLTLASGAAFLAMLDATVAVPATEGRA
jgi:hypothetical protein